MTERTLSFAFTPQQATSSSVFDYQKSPLIDLDTVFKKLKQDIQSRAKILDKPLRVKIAAWLTKLSEETRNDIWKKNRNSYAKLLHEQLKCGRIEEPFNAMPPSSPLPTFSKSLLYPYTKTKHSNTHTSTKSRHRMTPSQELDQYMYSGETSTAGLPVASPLSLTLDGAAAVDASTPVPFPGFSAVEDSIYIGAAPYTAASVAGGGKRRTARTVGVSTTAPLESPQMLHSVSQEPLIASEIEEEAAIGSLYAASEVELRLREAEDKLQRHSQLLKLALELSAALQIDNNSHITIQNDSQSKEDSIRVDDVLRRAEGWTPNAAAGRKKEQTPSRSPRKRSSTRENNMPRSSKPVVEKVAVPTEAELQNRLAAFEEGTAALRGKFGMLGNTSAVENALPIENNEQARVQNVLVDMKASNKDIIFPRHTLKSAAAAVAARRKAQDGESEVEQIENAGLGTSANLTSPGLMYGEAGSSHRAEKLRSLLKPRPGTTSALVAEVAALRNRLANSLASLESNYNFNIAPSSSIGIDSGGLQGPLGSSLGILESPLGGHGVTLGCDSP